MMKRVKRDVDYVDDDDIHIDEKLQNQLAKLPMDVIEKHVIPNMSVKDYSYLCKVDRRFALFCKTYGDRVWKMFIERDFPSLSAPR